MDCVSFGKLIPSSQHQIWIWEKVKARRSHNRKRTRMTSLSDQRHHEADTGGSPNTRDHRPRPFDEVLHQGDRATTTYRSEVTGSSTSGCKETRSDERESAEFSTSKGHDESEGVILGAEGADDPSLAIPEGLQTQIGGLLFPSSIIKKEDLVGLVRTFHLPTGHRVLILRASDKLAYPLLSYVAISWHHLLAGH
ncbi:hypothetical protein ACOSQ3_028729 [Xanthoceras sorbifolium]